MGGMAFSISTVWAQVFPFVALQFYENDEMKEVVTTFLIGCFALWLLLNVAFFCLIDASYLGTFFGTKTAPQYTCELYVGRASERAKRVSYRSYCKLSSTTTGTKTQTATA